MLERVCCAVVLGKFVKKKRKKEGKNKFMKSWKVEMRFVSNIKLTSTFFSFFRTMDPPMSTVQLMESLTAPLLSDISPPNHITTCVSEQFTCNTRACARMLTSHFFFFYQIDFNLM